MGFFVKVKLIVFWLVIELSISSGHINFQQCNKITKNSERTTWKIIISFQNFLHLWHHIQSIYRTLNFLYEITVNNCVTYDDI